MACRVLMYLLLHTHSLVAPLARGWHHSSIYTKACFCVIAAHSNWQSLTSWCLSCLASTSDPPILALGRAGGRDGLLLIHALQLQTDPRTSCVLLLRCVPAGSSLFSRVLKTIWCSGLPVQTWLQRAWIWKGKLQWHDMLCYALT